MEFGRPNRPSTPINGVISNHYGESAVHDIQQRYELQHELVSYLFEGVNLSSDEYIEKAK